MWIKAKRTHARVITLSNEERPELMILSWSDGQTSKFNSARSQCKEGTGERQCSRQATLGITVARADRQKKGHGRYISSPHFPRSLTSSRDMYVNGHRARNCRRPPGGATTEGQGED